MGCPDESAFVELAGGMLAGSARDELERHLEGCEGYRAGVVEAARMGTANAAHDPQLHRDVASKLLHTGVGDRERLLDEARAMARLSHPNAVTVHDAGAHLGRVFIAMEYVP